MRLEPLSVEQARARLEDCRHRWEAGPTWQDRDAADYFNLTPAERIKLDEKAKFHKLEIVRWRERLDKLISKMMEELNAIG